MGKIQIKPVVILGDPDGPSGNVFSVMGRCRIAALECGWTTQRWCSFMEGLMKLSSYEDVLKRINDEFEVI